MEEQKPGETHVALDIQILGVGRNGQMLVNVLEPGRCDLAATSRIRRKADTWSFTLLHLVEDTFYALPHDWFDCGCSRCPEMQLYLCATGAHNSVILGLNLGDISRRSGSKRRCGAACLTRRLGWVGRVSR